MLCHPACRTLILWWNQKVRWREQKLVEWHSTANPQNRPSLNTVYPAQVITLEEILSLLLSILSLRVTSSKSGIEPSFRAATAHKHDATSGTSMGLSPQDLNISEHSYACWSGKNAITDSCKCGTVTQIFYRAVHRADTPTFGQGPTQVCCAGMICWPVWAVG